MRSHRLCFFSVFFFLGITAFSWALEVGEVAPEFVVTGATDGEQIKLADFHGKSNVILTTFLQTQQIDTTFISQLQGKTEAFKTKYDAVFVVVVPASVNVAEKQFNSGIELYSDPDSSVAAAYGGSKEMHQAATFIIDKSGHIRGKFYSETATAPPTMAQLESELVKLKRDTPLPTGSPAPDFSLTEADGKTTFTLSDYQGKKNVLVTLLLQTY
ncbi:MAG: redoxin domain-containing protein [Candidatus Poribacteria bacterium]|nr:redoxin domain-containing protein [Candidatus Poribacteria bacterium]